MGLTDHARGQIERYAKALLAISEGEMRVQVGAKQFAPFRDKTLSLFDEGAYRSFYAPFDWINERADIVIVGVTPGKTQAVDALSVLRGALLAGKSYEVAAERAKQSASFKGTMRTLGARLMDHFRLHELFGVKSTLDLFGDAAGRTHYTSALRYPVLHKFENYSGDARISARPFMRRVIEEYLGPELAMFPRAWIVPFGPSAHIALKHLCSSGVLSEERVLGGILHPGGQQWNRYNVQLDLVHRDAAASVSGGEDVLTRSDELRRRVNRLISDRGL